MWDRNDPIEKLANGVKTLIMADKNSKEPKLPSREIAYAYTVAMHFAQRFEQNLRDILHTGGYLRNGKEMQLTPEEMWGLQTKEGFIDRQACAAILKKLRRSPLLKGKTVSTALTAFDNACEHRNELAHWFLTAQNFSKLTSEDEKEVLLELLTMTLDLYKACQISNAFANGVEYDADEHQQTDPQVLRKLMLNDAHEEITRQLMVQNKEPKRKRKEAAKLVDVPNLMAISS